MEFDKRLNEQQHQLSDALNREELLKKTIRTLERKVSELSVPDTSAADLDYLNQQLKQSVATINE